MMPHWCTFALRWNCCTTCTRCICIAATISVTFSEYRFSSTFTYTIVARFRFEQEASHFTTIGAESLARAMRFLPALRALGAISHN